jgi:hypothetical protein
MKHIVILLALLFSFAIGKAQNTETIKGKLVQKECVSFPFLYPDIMLQNCI